MQGGQIKQYQGHTCPLDGYELVLYSLSGLDGRTYPLCPLCYNHPPFEDAAKVGGVCGGGPRVGGCVWGGGCGGIWCFNMWLQE
jgi:DNA topoisomerase-3